MKKQTKEIKKINIPLIKVHYGTCDLCRRKNILIVHFNYHIQPKRDFRLCNRCYKKGQLIGLVEDEFLELKQAEVF